MRRGKQILYGFIYLVFWCVVVVGIWFLFFRSRPATVQVAGCGSNCLPASAQPIEALNGGNVMMFSSGPGSHTFLAEVANPNAGVAAQVFSYTFNFKDASGNVAQALQGQSFLYAGQVRYLLAPNEVVTSSVMSAQLSVGSTTWVNPSVLGGTPQIAQQNVSTTVAAGAISVTGAITDQDTSSFNNVLIIAIFENASGTPVGASQTELNNIIPGQIENFSIAYPAVPNVVPSATQIVVYAQRP